MRLKFSPHVLPPCRVCGAQATGYHYGANTCEPCKGFYHRMTKRGDKNLVCLKQNNCVINARNRGVCPACRYRKCLEAGMGKGNIKTGRYSYAKRSRDIIELQQSLRGPQGSKSSSDTSSLTIQTQSHQLQSLQDTLAPSLSSHSTTTSLSSASSCFEQAGSENGAQMQSILDSLITANEKVRCKIQQTDYELPTEQRQAISAYTSQFANAQTYELLVQWISTSFKQNNWSTYIKSIPNFKLLPMEDQVEVIKQGFLDFWVISCSRKFDVDNASYATNNGLSIPFRDILEEDKAREMVSVVKRLQELNLSKEECCALSAFAVLNTDTNALRNPDQMQELRMTMLNVLIYALKKNQIRPMMVYSKIISVLTQLRAIFHQIPQCLRSLPENLTPAIFREIVISRES